MDAIAQTIKKKTVLAVKLTDRIRRDYTSLEAATRSESHREPYLMMGKHLHALQSALIAVSTLTDLLEEGGVHP